MERTKKPRTETVELVFRGPKGAEEMAVRSLEALGFEREGGRDWRESSRWTDAERPGVNIRAARNREGLTQAKLTELTGINRRHLSEMENNKRPIGYKTAVKLSEALRVNLFHFLPRPSSVSSDNDSY